jgi:hypothetical protein
MKLEKIRKNIENFGFRDTLYDLSIKTINQVMLFKVLQGMKITVVDPLCLKIDNKYTHGFLTQEQLRRFAKETGYELTESFIKQAFQKGDECYGILDGDILAGYGWYSNQPTSIHPEDLTLHFSSEYIYMYKGFTHINYRGQRLHSIGMSWALKSYLERGFKGIVSYVETNNFSSLKSVYRMGYEDFGKVYISRLFDKYILHSDKGCNDYNFFLEVARPVALITEPERVEAQILEAGS